MFIGVWLLFLNGALCAELCTVDKTGSTVSAHNAVYRSRQKTEDVFVDDLPLLLTPLINDAYYDEAREKAAVRSEEFGVEFVSYAGFLTVDAKRNSNLWFWYFPVARQPVGSTPLILCLQEGISESVLIGILKEIGPLQFDASENGTFAFKPMEFSWAKEHSLLFIDNPVGAGYSFTEDASGYATNQVMVGEHLYSALQQFLTLFSELRSAPLVISGQGYAGKHVTSLAIQIHRHDQDRHINLKALMLGGSLVNPGAELGHSEFAYGTGLIDKTTARRMQARELRAKASLRNNDIGKARENYLSIINWLKQGLVPNIHNYLDDVPPKEDLNWFFHLHHRLRMLLHVGNTTYPHSEVVRAKLLPDYMNHTQEWLEELLDHYRVLCYSGQLDVLVPYALLEKFYDSLHWSGRDLYRRERRRLWYHGGVLAGVPQVWWEINHRDGPRGRSHGSSRTGRTHPGSHIRLHPGEQSRY